MKLMIVTVFSERIDAEKALLMVEANGIDPKEVSMVMKDLEKEGSFVNQESGTPSDGLLKGLSGIISGMGMVTIPEIGMVYFSGPIFTQAMGGGRIDLSENLSYLGLSSEEAEEVIERIHEGGLLLAMEVFENEVESVLNVFHHFHADVIYLIDPIHITAPMGAWLYSPSEFDTTSAFYSTVSPSPHELESLENEQPIEAVSESLKKKLKKLF